MVSQRSRSATIPDRCFGGVLLLDRIGGGFCNQTLSLIKRVTMNSTFIDRVLSFVSGIKIVSTQFGRDLASE